MRFHPNPQPKGIDSMSNGSYSILSMDDIPMWNTDIFGRPISHIKEDLMSDKTKKIVRATSTAITVIGVVGLFISGSTEADVSAAVKVGTMIASIIGSIVTLVLPRK